MSGLNKKKLDFLPEDYLARRQERRSNVIILVLFVCVVTGVLGAYFVTDSKVREVREQQEQVNVSYNEAIKRIEQLNELQEKKNAMLRKAQTTGTLLELVPRSFLLADLINRMPKSVSMFELTLASKAERASIVKINKTRSALDNVKKLGGGPKKVVNAAPPKIIVKLSLVGVAQTDINVSEYMSLLGKSELFTEINLVYSEEKSIEDSMLRKFRIDMELSPLADVRQLQPLRIKRVGTSSKVGITGGGADSSKLNTFGKPSSKSSVKLPSGISQAGSFLSNIFKKRTPAKSDIVDATND